VWGTEHAQARRATAQGPNGREQGWGSWGEAAMPLPPARGGSGQSLENFDFWSMLQGAHASLKVLEKNYLFFPGPGTSLRSE